MCRNKTKTNDGGEIRQNPYWGKIDHETVKSECWSLENKDISWAEICRKIFSVKQKSKAHLLTISVKNKNEIKEIKNTNLPLDFCKNELRILKACLKRWNFDIRSYKKGKSYHLPVSLAEFFFFLMTYDRSQKGFISKLKTGEEVTEAEEASFFFCFF